MLDFTNRYSQFRKGRAGDWNNMQDPTFLSFTLSFVAVESDKDQGDTKGASKGVGKSPLFTGAALDYLRDFCLDDERVVALEKFKDLFLEMNKRMPWVWQSISGLETATHLEKMLEPFKGGTEDSNVLTFETLETYDLMVTGLMDLYKFAAYDLKRYVEVIPKNMRKFGLIVTVGDCRFIQTERLNQQKQTTDQGSDDRKYIEINKNLSGLYKPRLSFYFGGCTFDVDTQYDTILADLKAGEAGEQAKQTIKIRYEYVKDIEVNYLNSQGVFYRKYGKFKNPVNSDTQINTEQPDETFEVTNDGDSFGNVYYGEGESRSGNDDPPILTDNTEELSRGNVGPEIGANLGNNIDLNLLTALRNKVESRGNSFIEGLEGSVRSALEGAAERITSDLIGSAILGNVHGGNTISNVQDALNAGGVNAILNLVNQETQSSNAGGGSLTSTNIFPNPPAETPLSRENINPPKSSESDMSSTNVYK